MLNYKIGSIIGQGGFGVVREAVRDGDGKQYVIKELKPGYNVEALMRFKREVRMLTQIRHKNIVPIIDLNLDADPPCFVMPRALLNLSQYISAKSGEEQLWLFVEAAMGVAYAHKNGIIHRDINPRNVLIYSSREGSNFAAVADFGLGRLVERDSPSVTITNAHMGTFAYCAPEQWSDAKSADERADVFALGKTMYEVLTGSPPFPSMEYSSVPRKFVYIIQKATMELPDKRYQTVNEMLEAIEVVTRSSQVIENPAEEAYQIIKKILSDGNFDSNNVESLVRFFSERADDFNLMISVFPRIPEPIIEAMFSHHLELTKSLLIEYDKLIDGPLAFTYCDVVADFYEKIFYFTGDDEVRILILRKLPRLGYAHNRYYVGHVFGRIRNKLTDPSLQMAVQDILNEDSAMAEWCENYI